MTDLRSLLACIEIASLALASGRASSQLDCIRIVRRTPWGARVPVSDLSKALKASLTFNKAL